MGPFSSTRPNPGKYEELKSDAQRILGVDAFEGAKFDFHKMLNQKLHVLHNIWLGGQQGVPPYIFGANFVDEERMTLTSHIDMGGRLTGRAIAQLTDSLNVKLQATAGPDSNSFKADGEYKGSSNYLH
eukprot:4642062-Prymnesium_polylepis.1